MSNNIFAPPVVQTSATAHSNALGLQEFFTVSTRKFMIMMVLTLGMYPVYWFYKQWDAQKYAHQLTVWPVPRAIFAIFFTHSLFRRIADAAQRRQLKISFDNHRNTASLFVGLTIVVAILGQIHSKSTGVTTVIAFVLYLAIMLLSFMPLLKAQTAINLINNDPEGLANTKITGANIFWIVIGILGVCGLVIETIELMKGTVL